MDDDDPRLERLRRATARPLTRPDGTPRKESAVERTVAFLNAGGTVPPPRSGNKTTLGAVMAKNGRKFPIIPDLTLADLDRHRRDGVPVHPIAAMRLQSEYWQTAGTAPDEITEAIFALWRGSGGPTEEEWPLIYRGFYRVRQ